MAKKLWYVVFYGCLLSIVMQATAMPVELYQVQLPVASQAVNERENAIRNGLVQILVKLTGDPLVEKNTRLMPSLEKPEFYIQEYSYLPNNAVPGYQLQIKYDAKSIINLLKRQKISFWQENRPLLLMWLTYQGKDQAREMINHENAATIAKFFTNEGKYFGVPLIFPMLDITDLNQVNTESFIKTPNSNLLNASKRYTPNALLVGEMVAHDDKIMSQWKLIVGEKEWSWSISQDSIEDVANEIMYQANKTLTNYFLSNHDAALLQSLQVEINHVNGKEELSILLKYIKQLMPVKKVELIALNGDVVQLNISLMGTLEAFQKNAALGKKLVLKAQDLENNKLFYEWAH